MSGHKFVGYKDIRTYISLIKEKNVVDQFIDALNAFDFSAEVFEVYFLF